MSEATVILGDCLDVLRGMKAGSVDVVAADPPYGIGYTHVNDASPMENRRSTTVVKWGSIPNDEAVDGRWLAEAFRVLREGGALYLCCRWDVEPEWRAALRGAGFMVKQRLTWHRRVHGKGDLRGTYANTCEDVLFATKGRHELRRRPSMLLDVGCVPTWEVRHHPHQKPVALSRLLIEASTIPGDTILDPHCGSGSTGVACAQTGRRFIGIEINPTYHAIAQRRIAEAQSALPLFATPEGA